MEEVEAICTKILLLNKGEVVLFDEIKNLKHSYRNNYILNICIDKGMNSVELEIPDVIEINKLTEMNTNEEIVYRILYK